MSDRDGSTGGEGGENRIGVSDPDAASSPPADRERWVTDGDLRSGWVSLPLLLAVVWLNDLPVLPLAGAVGVPIGPAYAYVENVLLDGTYQRGALLLVAVGAFAAVAIVGYVALAMWALLGAVVGIQALGYAERWVGSE